MQLQFIVVFAVLLAVSVSAFNMAPRKAAFSPKLSMKAENSLFKKALPAAAMPFLVPFASIAAEGTGRAFGIDDGRLVWAALLPSLIIFPLYNKWASDQEGDDFFDSYEKRRNG